MRIPLVGNDPVVGHIFSSTFRKEDIERLCEYVIQHEPKIRHLGTLESAMNEYEKFIDDVHKATGAPDWEYPGQVVRDVLLLRNQLYESQQANAELRRELDEAYEKCAEIAGRIFHSARATEEAHYRHTAKPFDLEAFGFSPGVVGYSKDCFDRIIDLKSTATK
jgi:hypothetical protein